MHDNCIECGLYKDCPSPCMSGSGSERPDILFIGEAPGKQESLKGEPFVGKAGSWLRNAIDTLELKPDEYRLTNAVRCRPPDNRIPRAKELKCCSVFLEEEIRQYEPSVVVLLGNIPLKAVLGESGITTWNGVAVKRGDITYVPAYHPSFFNYGNADKLEDWLRALGRAVEIVDGDDVTSGDAECEYVYPKYMHDVHAMRDELMDYDGYISYDVEAQYLEPERPCNRILSLSFGIEGKAWSLPIHHRLAEWELDDWEVIGVVEQVLTSKSIIGHNVRFDCKATRKLLGIEFKPWGDTMLISQLVDTRKGIHGLKRLAGLHLGMFDYDRELQDYKAEHPECDYNKGGHYGNVSLEVLLPYGGKDAAATWMLYDLLHSQLSAKQRVLYTELIQEVDYALGRIETNGFKLDKYIAERYRKIYGLVHRRYHEELLSDTKVKAYIEDRQSGGVSKRLAARYAKVYAKAKKSPKFVTSVLDGEPVKVSGFAFNPNSSVQMADVLYVYKGHEVPGRTDGGAPSVKADLIKNSSVKDDPIYETYRLWKLLSSMMSKYLTKASEGAWDVDGRARTNFNLGGTKTGRLSSSKPVNFQNIPTPEKEPGTLLAQLPIKNMFTHTWDGGCLCAVDYGSMELRVMASISNCPAMIKVFEDGKDPHAMVTRMVFPHLVPADATDREIKHEYRDIRYRAKWTNWTLLFGGGEYTLFRLYGLGKEEAHEIVETYYAKFPEILDYQERMEDFASRNGYVETHFGRRLYLPYINDSDRSKAAEDKRTAVNMPIQSLASDVLLCAITVIDHYMRKEKFKTLLVNTVHDSIVADVYPGELDAFATVCVDVMENIEDYATDFFPGLDFSWLRVPLIADVEIGSHYGVLEEYDEVVRLDSRM